MSGKKSELLLTEENLFQVPRYFFILIVIKRLKKERGLHTSFHRIVKEKKVTVDEEKENVGDNDV